MSRRVPVFVYAEDPISQAGVAAQLRGRPEVHVVADSDIDTAEVAVVIVSAVLISFLATIYPSRQASRLDPVQALRFE